MSRFKIYAFGTYYVMLSLSNFTLDPRCKFYFLTYEYFKELMSNISTSSLCVEHHEKVRQEVKTLRFKTSYPLWQQPIWKFNHKNPNPFNLTNACLTGNFSSRNLIWNLKHQQFIHFEAEFRKYFSHSYFHYTLLHIAKMWRKISVCDPLQHQSVFA